jgi:toxin CptA
MSSSSFASTVDLVLRPSARAHHGLFWLHIVPLALLPAAVPEGAPLIGIAFAIGASWIWLRRHPAFGYGPRALVRLTWHAEGHWSLTRAGQAPVEAELLGDSYRNSAILMLNFRITGTGQRCTRVLLGDEAPEEALRRLRARLQGWKPEEKSS